MSDWADEKAREWVKSATAGQPSDYLASSLAALLREVARDQLQHQMSMNQTLAEMRRVVEDEMEKWEHHSVAPLALREILSRLEKLNG